ncbi:MAG TPA: hypothetical protein VHZ31_04815 [Solirubrobacteraceae bacterium]|jgi:hypothetical protein|nr:hypothetical protein [Solirubrobacteraceae bacterium]
MQRVSIYTQLKCSSRAVKRCLLIGAVAGVAAGSTAASPATAFPHNWNCYAYSAGQCYDYQGYPPNIYYPWLGVKADVGDYVLSEVCAKGITAAGNYRTGSGCATNDFQKRACFSGGSPDSWAYVYWGGGYTGQITIYGTASTDGCP